MTELITKNIINAFTGTTPVKAIYRGTNKIWESGSGPVPPEPTVWGGLTYTALEDGIISVYNNGTNASTTQPNLLYSKDGNTWTEITDYTAVGMNSQKLIEVSSGEKLYVKGINNTLSSSTNNITSIYPTTGKFNVSGNVMSLLYGDDFEGKTSLEGKPYCFNCLFNKLNTIISPIETIVDASNLVLPATTLSNYCYRYLFYGNAALTSIPELPVTTLATGCYQSMFQKCTSLKQAPVLPATTLANYCYNSMFNGCTGLTSAPELPATTLGSTCYQSMFNGCTSLTEAPVLPATTLADGCYNSMFANCTSLTEAPELPATKLNQSCYSSMFANCTSLTEAPVLPATKLERSCYNNMFDGCTNLNSVKAYFTTNPTTQYTQYWLRNVASTGTFEVTANTQTTWYNTVTRGVSTIPTNWEVKVPNYGNMLKLNINSSSEEVRIVSGGSNNPNLMYSLNGQPFKNISSDESIFPAISDVIWFKGINDRFSTDEWNYTKIITYNGGIVSGNVMSLLYGDDFEGKTDISDKDYCFTKLFEYSGITEAYELTLPDTLSDGCFMSMFSGCSNLGSTPSLTKYSYVRLKPHCFEEMFKDCTSLYELPELPSNAWLEESCYRSMYQGCSNATSVTNTQEIVYEGTLPMYAFDSMFKDCSSLQTAPDLIINSAESYCASSMFENCSNINRVKCMFTPGESYTPNWLSGVSENGTFETNSDVSWDIEQYASRGADTVPEGWNIEIV